VNDRTLALCRVQKFTSRSFTRATSLRGIDIAYYSSSGEDPYTGSVHEAIILSGSGSLKPGC
jgi:hypothetical protein